MELVGCVPSVIWVGLEVGVWLGRLVTGDVVGAALGDSEGFPDGRGVGAAEAGA